jgi:hypothetical protein
LILALVTAATSSVAQLSTGAAASLANRYVWRGVTRVNGWVVQPSAWAVLRMPPAELSLSVWGDLEVGRAGPADLTDVGAGGRGLGELDVDIALARRVGSVGVAGGWTRYTFHGDPAAGGRGSERNTSEIYRRTQWLGSLLSPALMAACDIQRVRGCYAEGGLSLPVLATPEPRPVIALWLEPTVGWSAGQGVSDQPGQAANFAGSGLTHIDVPIGAQIQPRARVIEPSLTLRLHTQWSQDAATRATDAAGSTVRIKLWLELGVTVVAGLPKERRR